MKELQAQKLVVDAVEDGGGYGTKMSNRFTVGILDLLLKLPGIEILYLEAKLREWPKTLDVVKLDFTEPQKKHAKDSWKAGTLSGGISFLTKKNGFGVYIVNTPDLVDANWTAPVNCHKFIPNSMSKDDKFIQIRFMLVDFARANHGRTK
jgi:hypothetical protein